METTESSASSSQPEKQYCFTHATKPGSISFKKEGADEVCVYVESFLFDTQHCFYFSAKKDLPTFEKMIYRFLGWFSPEGVDCRDNEAFMERITENVLYSLLSAPSLPWLPDE